nr:hypothetical protein [Mesorhizobium loti]
MSAGIIVIYAALLGLAYLAGAGLYFGMIGTDERDRPANFRFERDLLLQQARTRRRR